MVLAYEKILVDMLELNNGRSESPTEMGFRFGPLMAQLTLM